MIFFVGLFDDFKRTREVSLSSSLHVLPDQDLLPLTTEMVTVRLFDTVYLSYQRCYIRAISLERRGRRRLQCAVVRI
jgi:hypothetical protein